MKNSAVLNLIALSKNSYPGRMVFIGLSDDGKYIVHIVVIMGRSPGSRNRVYRYNEKWAVWTEVADLKKEKGNAELTIYNSMMQIDRLIVSGNGAQVGSIIEINNNACADPEEILTAWDYEPDEPNWTPRITGWSQWEEVEWRHYLSVIRKNPNNTESIRKTHPVFLQPGLGYYISTYLYDGNPLPPFTVNPVIVPFEGDIENVGETIKSNINKENFVSCAVKYTDITTQETQVETWNKYKKVR